MKKTNTLFQSLHFISLALSLLVSIGCSAKTSNGKTGRVNAPKSGNEILSSEMVVADHYLK